MVIAKKLQLKTILRPYEAAEYVGHKLGENFSESDLYFAALNKKLVMSNLVRGTSHYQKCKITRPLNDFEIFDTNYERSGELDIGEDKIFDLAMVGLEVDYLKSLYESRENDYIDECLSKNVEHHYCFLDNDNIVLIYEDFDSNINLEGSYAWYEFGQPNYTAEQLAEYSSIYQAHLEINKEKRAESFKKLNRVDFLGMDFVESPAPMEVGQLVVRIDDLDRFSDNLLRADDAAPESLSLREKRTLLVVIAALCKEAKIDFTQRGVASAIEMLTEQIGAPISDDTIRKILKQIPKAVESREK